MTAVPSTSEGKFNGFLNMIGLGRKLSHEKNLMDIDVTEIDGPAATDICIIKLSTDGGFNIPILLIIDTLNNPVPTEFMFFEM